MKRIYSSILPIAGAVLFSMIISLSSASVDAAEHRVTNGLKIQEVISSSTFTSGDSIVVEPGTYFGPIKLPNNITIKGIETARTFLSGSGSGPVITAEGSTIATIQNFTFINASSGILVSNNPSGININNNVFQVGTGGTAVTIQNSSTATRVINNTFYQNGTALTTDSNIQIINNIFSNNLTAIVDPFIVTQNTNILNNAFFANSVNTGPTGTNFVLEINPGFADTGHDPRDFHLKVGSPCIDKGSASSGTDFDNTQSDIGAYGGSSADQIPFPITNLSTLITDMQVELDWPPNNCYLMTNGIINNNPDDLTNKPGIYWIYFGTTSGGPWMDPPIPVSAPTVSFPFPLTEEDLSALGFDTTTTPSAPVLDPPSPRDSALQLTWSEVPGATGYNIHYGISSVDENTPIDVGLTTSYTLSGLTNGPEHPYRVAVSAYTQTKIFFVAVVTYRETDLISSPSATSNQVSVDAGSKRDGSLSNVESAYSEPVVTYPALPNASGRCFIATAAYGNYSAPEVLALRAFRDRYLLTSATGRMFVEWYYLHGPAAAALLNDHPGYKPLVRAALMPVVGTAIFMTETSMMFKAFVFLVLSIAIAFGFFRRRLSRAGGLH